jgi:hypothetical protein
MQPADRTTRSVEYIQWQPVAFTSIPAGGTQVAGFKQDAGRDFVVTKLHGTLRDASNVKLTTDPLVTMQVRDTAGNWDQGAVPFEHMFGNAREAAYMTGRMPVIAAGATVQFTAVNGSSAACIPSITLEGYYRNVNT